MSDTMAGADQRRAAGHPAIALEFQRCRALERCDLDALQGILSETLIYVHSTGAVHDRAGLLEHLSRDVRFSLVERSGMAIAHWGSVAICTGLMRLDGFRVADNVPFLSISFVTQAWTNHGTGWRLGLMQSTRVADAMWPATNNTTGTING